MDYLELLRDGGITIYPLLAVSIVSFAIIINKIFEFFVIRKTIRSLHPEMVECVKSKDLKKMEGILTSNIYCRNMYESIIHNLEKGLSAAKRLAEVGRQRDLVEIRRHIWLLGTIGSMAPFIGLFGTVIGIMRSFKNIAAVGSGGFSVVAGGISEALIATAGGLFVGVVSIFFYNYFTVRAHQFQEILKANEEEIFVLLETHLKIK